MGYSLHIEPTEYTLSGGPETTDFLGLLGFEMSRCGFVARGVCYVRPVVSDFNLDEFSATFEKIITSLKVAYKNLFNCGYSLPQNEGLAYFTGQTPRSRYERDYDGDGHNALQNPDKLKQSEDEFFKYHFTFQTTEEGKGWTIHISSKNIISEEMRSALSFVDLPEFPECPQFNFDPCFWFFIPYTGSDFSDGNAGTAHAYFDAHTPQFLQGIKALMDANSAAKELGMDIYSHD